MIYKILFFLFLGYVIYIKHKRLCTDCKDATIQDIIKVISVGIFIYYMIGARPVILSLIFAFLVHVVVKTLSLLYEKATKKVTKKDCGYCHNPWM